MSESVAATASANKKASTKKTPAKPTATKAKPFVVEEKKSTPKKEAKSKPKHQTFNEMVSEAIKNLADRSGSSKEAILKYISANFQIDPKPVNQHLKVAPKNGIKNNAFKQTSGVGASGSFKLSDNNIIRSLNSYDTDDKDWFDESNNVDLMEHNSILNDNNNNKLLLLLLSKNYLKLYYYY
jgi:hypothetical protein